MSIEVIVQAVSAILVAGGLFFTARQLYLTQKSQKDNHDWYRRNAAQEATLDYPAKIEGSEKLNKALKYSIAKEPIPLKEIQDVFEEKEALRVICHKLLNYHESLAVGVENRVFDETIIKDIRKSTITLLFNAFKNYVDHVRKELQPTAWEKQEELISKWNKEQLIDRWKDKNA